MSAPNPYYDAAKPHHTPQGFVNNDREAKLPELSFAEQVYYNFTGYFRPTAPPEGGYDAFARAWSARPALDALRANDRATTVTWLGHASVLLQIEGLNVLTDPIASERASPVSFTGPIRRVPAPAMPEALPKIDVVVVSHNHYDHLDRPTVLALHRANPEIRFLVPLGLAAWFRHEGIANVRELDWWDTVDHGPLRITATPVQHWSKRTIWDRNRSLWAGWMVENRRTAWRFYFSGDTGYSADFKAIRQRLGPVDLAALPIGAYEPRDFMRVQHANPEDAVRMALDLDARTVLGVHWGTFELTQEPFDRPPLDLATARAKLGMADERFFVMKHGETRRIGAP